MDSIENVLIKEFPYVICTTSLTEAAQKFHKHNASQFTVVDSEKDLHPVGILDEHGLMGRCLSRKEALSKVIVEDCMDDAAIIFSSDMDSGQILKEMNEVDSRWKDFTIL